MNISRLLMILPLFLCVNALDCFADEMNTVYSFRSGVVEECLIDAQFGLYTLEELMQKDTFFKDDVYGVIDGWVKGTHMNGDKWIEYYKNGYNAILTSLGVDGYKFSLGTAYDVCIDTFRPIKDDFARNIDHSQGCADFVKKISETTTTEINSNSQSVCEQILMKNKDLSKELGDRMKRHGTYYCGGTCKTFGDDTVYILDEDKNVILKQQVDDFCDGEYVGRTDIWYESSGWNKLTRITNEYVINDLSSRSKEHKE